MCCQTRSAIQRNVKHLEIMKNSTKTQNNELQTPKVELYERVKFEQYGGYDEDCANEWAIIDGSDGYDD